MAAPTDIPPYILVTDSTLFDQVYPDEALLVRNLITEMDGKSGIDSQYWQRLDRFFRITTGVRFPSYLELFKAEGYDGDSASLSVFDLRALKKEIEHEEKIRSEAEVRFSEQNGKPAAIILPDEDLSAYFAILKMPDYTFWGERTEEDGTTTFEGMSRDEENRAEREVVLNSLWERQRAFLSDPLRVKKTANEGLSLSYPFGGDDFGVGNFNSRIAYSPKRSWLPISVIIPSRFPTRIATFSSAHRVIAGFG